MIARHIELTASGKVSPQTTGSTNVEVYVVGVSVGTGITSVKLHDSIDVSGPVAYSTASVGTNSWNYELAFPNGCYAEIAGSGSVSIWVA